MNQKIIFNGKEYNSVEDMPPDARQAYESAMGQFSNMFADGDRDGVPDLFETLTAGKTPNMQVFSTSNIIFDGKSYNNVEDMPAEARQRYEQAFQDKNRDGVPDVFENMGHLNVLQGKETPTHHSKFPTSAGSVHSPVGVSPKVWLLIAGVIILLLVLVVFGLVFVLIL